MLILETKSDEGAFAESLVDRIYAQQLVSRLPHREQLALFLRFGFSLPFHEVGKHMLVPVSGERVRQIIMRAFRRIRRT